MYNNTGSKTFDNCWDFVGEDAHGLFMDIDSELVGKNFLYMLTEDTYAGWLKDAFEALSADEQAYFQPTIDEMASEAESLGLGENGKYALAWIKLWVGSYNAQTDDGPICNTLVDQSAPTSSACWCTPSCARWRSPPPCPRTTSPWLPITTATPASAASATATICSSPTTAPLPWTACAFIAYMTCTADGLLRLGQGHRRLLLNPLVAEENEEIYHHQTGGMAEDGTTVEFAALNDHGYDWWTTDGKLVLEDPEYCASVAFTVGSWIEMLDRYTAG